MPRNELKFELAIMIAAIAVLETVLFAGWWWLLG